MFCCNHDKDDTADQDLSSTATGRGVTMYRLRRCGPPIAVTTNFSTDSMFNYSNKYYIYIK